MVIPRALLQRPAWPFLDEATSALDEPSQAQVYRLLAERLKDTTIITIAHRAALVDFHTKLLELRPDGHTRGRVIVSGAPVLA